MESMIRLIISFSGAGEDSPAPRIWFNASLRYAAVKVPRGGSPGSRMLDAWRTIGLM